MDTCKLTELNGRNPCAHFTEAAFGKIVLVLPALCIQPAPAPLGQVFTDSVHPTSDSNSRQRTHKV